MRISDWSSDVCSSDLGVHKQRYRIVDFKRRKWDVPATVERLEYDPNRSAFIALVKYEDGEVAYILAPQRVAAGDQIVAGKKVDVKPGNAMEIGQVPIGTIVHNVELKPGKGGQIARAAGTYVQRSEEHTSELQSLMRISYAVFCLKKKKQQK